MAKSNTLENHPGGLDIMTWLRLNLAASTSCKHDHGKHWSTWMWRIKISANILLRTICHGMATVYVFGTRSKCMRCLSISHFSIMHLKPPRQSSLFSRKRKQVSLNNCKTDKGSVFTKSLLPTQNARLPRPQPFRHSTGNLESLSEHSLPQMSHVPHGLGSSGVGILT